MNDVSRNAHEDPLLGALRDENERLRAQNRILSEEMVATRAAQEELAKHLKVTAPLRRVQECLRHRAGDRRRRASGGAGIHPPASPRANPDSGLVISDAQAARHPLLARTRDWLAGQTLLPDPRVRPVRTGCAGRVLVIAHVFYPELWPLLAERIARIPGPVDLVVTLVEGRSGDLADTIVAQFPQVQYEVLPNRGRDMWPFVRVLELGLVGDYDAVLKLHTKASVHRIDGDAWRDRLLDSLCPSPEGIGLILDLLRSDPGIGMVAPEGGVLGREFWGSNRLMVDALAIRTGIGVDPDRVWFPGGSMFWSRPDPLNRLRDARLTVDDFEHEAVSIDGTTAHALERFVGALAAHSGLAVIAADEVAGRLAQTRPRNEPGETHAG